MKIPLTSLVSCSFQEPDVFKGAIVARRKYRFVPRTLHVGFVLDERALEYILLSVIWFPSPTVIPPILNIHSSPAALHTLTNGMHCK
jgi:hypothetical protein